MARITTANWTQNGEVSTAPKVVFTNKNTDFDTWKKMMHYELMKEQVDINIPNRLSVLHAWEGGNTPYNFAQECVNRIRKAKSRLV